MNSDWHFPKLSFFFQRGFFYRRHFKVAKNLQILLPGLKVKLSNAYLSNSCFPAFVLKSCSKFALIGVERPKLRREMYWADFLRHFFCIESKICTLLFYTLCDNTQHQRIQTHLSKVNWKYDESLIFFQHYCYREGLTHKFFSLSRNTIQLQFLHILHIFLASNEGDFSIMMSLLIY